MSDFACLISIIGEYLICTDVQSPEWTRSCEKFEKWAVLADSYSQIQNQIWPEALILTPYKAALISALCNAVEIQEQNICKGDPW